MISVFHSRELCYLSSEFFSAKIEETLESLDLTTDIIIDINSKLPQKKNENGDFWLDLEGARFFNYILDHPLYHHKSLSVPLNNYHVLCVSQTHKDYILKHYPHIKSVNIMPIPGTSPLSLPKYVDREDALLFQGSFISPGKISDELKTLRETYGSSYSKILGDMMDYWEPFSEPIEAALESYLEEEGIVCEELPFCKGFPELLNLLFPVDRIKRNIYREDVLFRLKDEVPLLVMGTGWEESRLKNAGARIVSEEMYSVALQKNSKYKFVLDINPFFSGGIHDRVSNGFAAGSLVFSNMKSEDNKGPLPDKTYIRYEGDDISSIVDAINDYDQETEYISASGMSYWMDNLTWEKWGKKFLKILG